MLTSELANGDDHQLALKWDGASSFSFFLDGVQQGDPVDVSGLGASFSSANTDPIWIAGLAGDACCNSSTDSATVAIDDLSIDSNGDGTMELYDDFTGTRLDLANSYLVGERYRRIENQAMTFGFGVSDLGPYVINYLRVQNAARLRAIAADIRVDEIAVSGGGVASLRARGFLFNDGTGGPGVIGDIIGTVQMDGSQAYFTMSRCDTAGCESFTAITPPGGIVLGNVTLGSTHTLYLDWDGTVATFQLDDNPPGTFDPTSVGVFPAGPPNGQSWAIGSYTESDGVGKTAFIKGSIDNVKAW
jgi:hypothetical protein